ncbi:MAG: metal ABC transporter permease [Rhodospirillaceae bacterium]|nr:metal ABC transporter permease [Rhodospirillaceae bacterium]OUT78987.1 MAG: metal ABC transporter permease [Rhodospirillaceae bacterium TMED23]|tara:strand:+ start:677 stop:2509 length:1833 start_codon:yes stop_codon:yes gene_type:complete
MRSLGSNTTDNYYSRDDVKTLKTLLPYLWPKNAIEMRVRVILALFLLAFAKGINVYAPILYKLAVDQISTTTESIIVVPVAILIAYGIARTLALAFGELRDAIFAKVAQRAIRQAGLQTFRHLHKLAMRFHIDRQTGGLSRSVERGTKGIDFLLNFMLFNVIPTLLEIFLVCGILWGLFNFWYAFVTLITVGSYISWTVIVTEWRLKYRRQMNKMDGEANTKAIDSLLNYETVKYFSNEEHEAKRFDTALRSYESSAIKSKVSLSYLNIGQGAVISVGMTILMIMAGYGVRDGNLSIGDFVLINSYLIQLFLPLNFLGFVYREIKQSLTDMNEMFRLLEQETEIDDIPNAPNLKLKHGEINFKNVEFYYNKKRNIINNISFTIKPGDTVAIVGSSGSGKSTISRLLYRFYDVTNGSISIDGQDIKSIAQNSLRNAIGIVPQDTVLFNDSIYYNISYGRPNASPSEIEEAARLSAIHEFINNAPDGYNTRVGERGLKLSGGEKQRVAIARTILKNPKILIFDEATSALDTSTEREIQKSINNISANRTVLVIAHRLSTIIDADKILVLEQGTIVERGTHQKLLANKGRYAKMWYRQQEAAKAEETLAKNSL